MEDDVSANLQIATGSSVRVWIDGAEVMLLDRLSALREIVEGVPMRGQDVVDIGQA